MSSIIRRGLLLASTACCLVATPTLASAATLVNAGGVLTYTGADTASVVLVGANGSGGLSVTELASRPDQVTSAVGCTQTSSTPGSSTDYTCPGATSLVARLGGGDDSLSVVGAPSTIDGGGGDDSVTLGRDADVHGGSGIDTVRIYAPGAPEIRVTLDDAADDVHYDGSARATDNIHSDVEDVQAVSGDSETAPAPSGTITLAGSAAANSLSAGGPSRAVIDGGAGNDLLTGSVYDDSISAADGFADRIVCRGGDDTVAADQFDTVSSSCEHVTVQRSAPPPPEDAAPSVAWTAPADGATLPTTSATTLSVAAADDQGIAKVQFLAGSRIVCEDTAAPYTCAYIPTGADSARQTLTAIAIDGSQQTASAGRSVKVARFVPAISQKLAPGRDLKAPYSFRVTGTLTPPAGLSKAEACGTGVIATTVKAGSKTISTRRVTITSSCTYSSTATFKSRSRFGRASKLKISVRFGGNALLAPRTLTTRTVRIR